MGGGGVLHPRKPGEHDRTADLPTWAFPPSVASKKQHSRNKSRNLKWWPFYTEPSLVKGDGDGTVNIRSLKGCLRWEGAQKQAVHHKIFKGINHVDMLRREEPTTYVVDTIDGLNKQLQKTKVNEVRTSAVEGNLEAAPLGEA